MSIGPNLGWNLERTWPLIAEISLPVLVSRRLDFVARPKLYFNKHDPGDTEVQDYIGFGTTIRLFLQKAGYAMQTGRYR
jgi:hypothetical protein